jgi:hypothetical protein
LLFVGLYVGSLSVYLQFPSPFGLIITHIFATYANLGKCKEILRRKIDQEAPEERGALREPEEKPQCFRVAILEPSAK